MKKAPQSRFSEHVGYVPPTSYNFTEMRVAVAHLIVALCSRECQLFMDFVESHPTREHPELHRCLSPYALADWAASKIPRHVYEGRGPSLASSLQTWAVAMVELNSVFRAYDIRDPIDYIEKQGLAQVSEVHSGWDADLNRMAEVLRIDVRAKDMTGIYETKPSDVRRRG